MLRFGRPSFDELSRVLEAQRSADVTYTDVGATQPGSELPVGYQHDRYSRSLGAGNAVFAAACDGLRAWACHDGADLMRSPERPELREGVTLVQALPVGPAYVPAACRIVWVVDEPDRFGFAYGTLPAHPETGEEAFVVHRDGSGGVSLEITVFSRARHPLARLGWLVGRQIQVRVTNRFLDGLESFVRGQMNRPSQTSE
ncbi:MAG: hypothetical protein QOG87_2253 [Actinomycetota bacterium]|jgi:uncharacterized protein (UPF0548 family)